MQNIKCLTSYNIVYVLVKKAISGLESYNIKAPVIEILTTFHGKLNLLNTFYYRKRGERFIKTYNSRARVQSIIKRV